MIKCSYGSTPYRSISDWECLRGTPLYARIGGLRRPARRVLGSDIAGVVESVGAGVTRFRPGDAVYGDNLGLEGGFAEYALVPESALAPKPDALTFAEASTLPQAGAIALQGIAGAGPGDSVLINGAGGGSGSFAIQLAKRLGAHVTGVDNSEKLEFMRSVGADEVIDYREQDFTRAGAYDLVLDLVAQRSVLAYHRALARGGRYRCVGGTTRTLDQRRAAGTTPRSGCCAPAASRLSEAFRPGFHRVHSFLQVGGGVEPAVAPDGLDLFVPAQQIIDFGEVDGIGVFDPQMLQDQVDFALETVDLSLET